MGRQPNKLKQNPKLVQKPLSDGRASLSLEFYFGRTSTPVLDDDGNPVLHSSGAMKGKPKYKVTLQRKLEGLLNPLNATRILPKSCLWMP